MALRKDIFFLLTEKSKTKQNKNPQNKNSTFPIALCIYLGYVVGGLTTEAVGLVDREWASQSDRPAYEFLFSCLVTE